MIITYETESSTYKDKKSLYINATNKCNNRCTFCHRFNRELDDSKMDELWLEHEPTKEEILHAVLLRNPESYDAVVFCGYGEPTCRLDEILWVAEKLKENYQIEIRLNTNGLANTLYNEDITPRLKDKIDVVSVSLNAKNAQEYDALCRPLAEDAFDQLLTFTKNAGRWTKTYMTVIDSLPEEDIKACRKLAEDAGAELKVRTYLR
ncbi:MAG: TatD family nuclease-associated radical SAM protein [Eubacterium sp.]